jgi:hypothetical protein
VAGSLFIREQKKFMISLTQKPLASHVSLFNICPHLEFISVEGFKGYWIPQTTTATCDEPEDCEGGKGISQCEYCFTEFQIDFKHVEGCGDAMFFTRWLDLGEGRSPLDSKWQSHVEWRIGGILVWLPIF